MSVEKRNPFAYVETSKPYYKDGAPIGAYVSNDTKEYIRLLAMHHGTGIQGILERMIEYWISQQDTKQSLIVALAGRAYSEWTRRCTDLTHAQINEKWPRYVDEVRDRLRSKKISSHTISQIIHELRRHNEKN